MAEPRAFREPLDAKAARVLVTAADGAADSGSSGQVLEDAPADHVSPALDAPGADPSAGLDARLGASAAFEDWTAGAVVPALDVSGRVGGLPGASSNLDGLAGGSMPHSPGLPGTGVTPDAASLLGGSSSDSTFD
jgi:hypothetical protein